MCGVECGAVECGNECSVIWNVVMWHGMRCGMEWYGMEYGGLLGM